MVHLVAKFLEPWSDESMSGRKCPEKQSHGNMPSLKLTASLHLKIDGWKMKFPFWDGLFFSFREGKVKEAYFFRDLFGKANQPLTSRLVDEWVDYLG